MEDIRKYIRAVPDFPKPGIQFYDLTTLMEDPEGFRKALDAMEGYGRSRQPTKIVGIEARGFVFGGALADRMHLPFVVIRKPGKLPAATESQEYDLEYGSGRVEIHRGTIQDNDRVLIVDDLIATGGTVKAAIDLVRRLGGEVVGVSAVVALTYLPYRETLSGVDLNYLATYESE